MYMYMYVCTIMCVLNFDSSIPVVHVIGAERVTDTYMYFVVVIEVTELNC